MPANQGGRLGGFGALLLVQLFFGLFPVFGKLAFEDFTPSAVAGWRFVVGALALGAIAWSRYGRRMLPARGDWGRLFACSMLGVVLNMVIFMEGLERSTAVHAGLFMPVIPIWTFGIAVCLRQERFDLSRGLGMLLACTGRGMLLFQKGIDFESSYFVGDLCFVVNTFCYSLYLVLSKPLLARMSALSVSAWVFILSVWTVPLFAWGEDFAPAAASTASWLSLAYVLVFPTVIAYLLNSFALARVSASTNATFIFLQPLIAVTGGVLLLGEPFLSGTARAAGVILIGVWLVIRRRAVSPLDAGPIDPRGRDGRAGER